jgi:hypothetical protein
MAKFKVTQAVVNRAGKRYIAEKWIIEVEAADVKHFEGFEEIKTKKTKKDEDTKKES